MTKFFKLFLFTTHVSAYKRRWVRRAILVLSFPQEIVRACYTVFTNSRHWWQWDGSSVDPATGLPVLK